MYIHRYAQSAHCPSGRVSRGNAGFRHSTYIGYIALVLLCTVFCSPAVLATTTVSATGAESLTADTRTGGSAASYKSVSTTNPAITEGAVGEIASSIVITAPANWVFNTSQSVTATVTGGNLALTSNTATPASGTITFAVASASNNSASTVTFSNIQIRPSNCTGATAGTANVTVTTDGSAGAEDLNGATLAVLTVTAGSAYQLAFTTEPTSASSKSALVPAVAVQDACANTVTSDTRNITLRIGNNAGSTGELDGTLTVACSSGVATWTTTHSLDIDVAGTGYTLIASHGGSALGGSSQTATSAAFNITVGTAYQLAFTTQPANSSAGSNLLPVVAIQDVGGNVVSTSDRTITLSIYDDASDGTASLLGGKSVNTVNGLATWRATDQLSIEIAGENYTLLASHSSANLAGSQTVESYPFTVLPDSPDHLSFVVQPVNTQAEHALLPAVAVLDEYGNVVTDDGRTILLSIGTDPSNGLATLSGDDALNCVNGVATWGEVYDLNIDVATNGYTLVASHHGDDLPGGDTVTSSLFNITAREQTAGEDGSIEISNSDVDVVVEGLQTGATTSLDTDTHGRTTLIATDSAGATVLSLAISGLESGGRIVVAIDSNGTESMDFLGTNGLSVFAMELTGLGSNGFVDISIDEEGDQLVAITDLAGSELTFDLESMPNQATMALTSASTSGLNVSIDDDDGGEVDLLVLLSELGDQQSLSITFNHPVEAAKAARVVPDLVGFAGEESLGGSVSIGASGLPAGSTATILLSYLHEDLSGKPEASLRLQRQDRNTGIFVPAGSNDVGAIEPTGCLADYGVDIESNWAWAEVSQFGTFAIGIPKSIEPVAPAGCGAGVSMCAWCIAICWIFAALRLERGRGG